MDFVPEADLERMLSEAHLARVTALIHSGYSKREAGAIADKEFASYDVVEVDQRGWVRIDGLELPDMVGRKP